MARTLFEAMPLKGDVKLDGVGSSIFIGVKLPDKNPSVALIQLEKPLDSKEFDEMWAHLLEELKGIMGEWIS